MSWVLILIFWSKKLEIRTHIQNLITMNTRILLPLSALTLTAFAAEGKKKSPNIIVVFADDQAYEDLGCYGSPLIKTPCIDKMAAEGLRFTDFYTTSSVSSASRARLLIGKMNHRT